MKQKQRIDERARVIDRGFFELAQRRKWLILLILTCIFVVGVGNYIGASQENAEDLYNLGQKYYSGEGVEQDYDRARVYFEQAAEKGNAQALNSLGKIYDYGYGVRIDYSKARAYYEQAIEKGDIDALYNLGIIYYRGDGVDEDYTQARSYCC